MKTLLIEDDHRIAFFIRKGLEQERITVEVAFNGQTGYELGLSGSFDVIILDNMLPLKTGVAVCRDLRSAGIATPILFLTAKNTVADTVEGLQAGADDYLAKPFDFDELLARLHALSRRPQHVVATTLRAGDLSLDPTVFSVSRGGKAIKLSKREFLLLEYLLRHKSLVLTKEQILAAVWEHDTEVTENTVEVYMGYLRKKIDAAFPNSPKLLHTKRGFGYVIQEPAL